MKRFFYLPIVLVTGALLMVANAAQASPKTKHAKAKPLSYNVIDVANRWFGMSLEEFEKAAKIDPSKATIQKTTSLSGKEQTQLMDLSAPVLKDMEPENLDIMVYVFDDTGHLVEMDGYVKQGVSDVEAVGRMAFINGMPPKGNQDTGFSPYMWAIDDVAVEISAGAVYVWRLPAGCTDAIKASTPMDGCGRP